MLEHDEKLDDILLKQDDADKAQITSENTSDITMPPVDTQTSADESTSIALFKTTTLSNITTKIKNFPIAYPLSLKTDRASPYLYRRLVSLKYALNSLYPPQMST